MTREEAIKVVKSAVYTPEEMEALETLIPELAESEDERIINQLINLVNNTGEILLIPTNKEELISWLEKQKEEADKRLEMVELHCKEVQDFDKKIQALRKEWYGEKQKEQKPENGTVLKGFVAVDYCDVKTTWNPTGRRVSFFTKKPVRDLLTEIHYWASTGPYYERIKLGYECFPELKWEDEPVEVELLIYGTEQKPKQEWSEEDERMRKLLIAILEVNHPDGFFKANELGDSNMRGVHTEEIISWLKSLRPQPKQRWTMEDWSMLCDIAGYVDGSGSSSGITNQERVDFLYKLPKRFNLPQLHWKPSEEQMEALKHYVDTTTDGEIDLLYNDLKKLI